MSIDQLKYMIQSEVQKGIESARSRLNKTLNSHAGVAGPNPWLVSVLGSEYDKDLLPHFVEHYMAQGIAPDRFLLTLHHSDHRCMDHQDCVAQLKYFMDFFKSVRIILHADHWLGPFSSIGQKTRKDALLVNNSS